MSEEVKTGTSAETLTEEERRRREYNSRIGENYRRMMTMDSAALTNEMEQERRYPSLDAYRPLHARREITFEDVQIPESIRRETETYAGRPSAPAPKAKAAPSAGIDFQNSIYASPAYRAAALRREQQKSAWEMQAEEADETLAMPTATTLQYGKATLYSGTYARAERAPEVMTAPVPPYAPPAAARPAAMPRVVATPAEDAHAYYAALLKKVIVCFAVAFVVLMVVIAVNSAILSSMDAEIATLQQTLDALANEVAALQESVNAYIVPGENGVPPAIWDFIVENGMVPA